MPDKVEQEYPGWCSIIVALFALMSFFVVFCLGGPAIVMGVENLMKGANLDLTSLLTGDGVAIGFTFLGSLVGLFVFTRFLIIQWKIKKN